MQRDVEIEIETTDKSGGFIGALYLNKNENAAVTLVSEGLATVHSFSADTLSWSKQLYDAEDEAKKPGGMSGLAMMKLRLSKQTMNQRMTPVPEKQNTSMSSSVMYGQRMGSASRYRSSIQKGSHR